MSADGRMIFEFLSKGIEEIVPKIEIEQWKSPELCFHIMHSDDLEKFKDQLMASFNKLSLLHCEYRSNLGNEDV